MKWESFEPTLILLCWCGPLWYHVLSWLAYIFQKGSLHLLHLDYDLYYVSVEIQTLLFLMLSLIPTSATMAHWSRIVIFHGCNMPIVRGDTVWDMAMNGTLELKLVSVYMDTANLPQWSSKDIHALMSL